MNSSTTKKIDLKSGSLPEATLNKGKDKSKLSLLPWPALLEIADVREKGRLKHGDTWRNGLSHRDYLDAAIRHIAAYADGERIDSESGLSHLAHACCSLMFIITWLKENTGVDDLPKHKYDTTTAPETF